MIVEHGNRGETFFDGEDIVILTIDCRSVHDTRTVFETNKVGTTDNKRFGALGDWKIAKEWLVSFADKLTTLYALFDNWRVTQDFFGKRLT